MATLTSQFNRGVIAQTGSIPTGMKFINDVHPLRVEELKSVMVEGTGQVKKPVLRVTGVFQKADAINENRRVYPRDILVEAVEHIKPDIGRRAVMGEYDHPQDAKLHLERVSHLITKLWIEGKYVYGEAEVIEDTDCGRNLAALLRAGVTLGVSSRGVGEMESINEGTDDEHMIVQPGYRFVTWDVVAEPSVSESVLTMMESKRDCLAAQKKVLTRADFRKSNPHGALLGEIGLWLRS